jgi:alpha-beta hydrolase superfamily lysophospholipase
MKEEAVWFENSKGQKLCGLLALQDHKAPAILFVHGMMPQTDKHEYGFLDRLVPYFFKQGYSTFRFDFHAHGESEGEYKDVRVEQEVDDLKHAVDFFTEKNIDKNNIGILATSFGAVVTILLNDSRIKVMVLNSPAAGFHKKKMSVFDKHLEKNWQDKFKEKGFAKVIDKGLEERKEYIGVDFYKDIKSLDISNAIKKVKQPILILAAGKDKYINLEDTKEVYKHAIEPKEIKVYEWADHGFSNNEKEIKVFIEETSKWFNKWLK